MKKLFSIAIIMISFIFFSQNVYANTISNIDIDVFIDARGNAKVTETWGVNLVSGTEGYRPFKELENMNIVDFSVSDESGTHYTDVGNWNSNWSFEQKKYKSGINYIDDGLELCFGISKYGYKIYTLNYTITNFVTQYTDAQGIYFNFLKFDMDISNAHITIHSDTEFSKDNTKIWGFGYEGNVIFSDGNIEMETKKELKSGSYMVLLAKFENDLFKTTSKSSKSFEDVLKEAQEKDKKIPFLLLILIIRFVIISPIIFVVIACIAVDSIWVLAAKSNVTLSFKSGRNLPKEVDYYREIPCDGNLIIAYFISKNYYLNNNTKSCIIGSYLLKWYRDKIINIVPTKKGILDFKDNKYAVDLTKDTKFNDDIENQLFNILKDAASDNGILEPNEFKKWCKRNYKIVDNWFESIDLEGKKILKDKKYIIDTTIEEKTMLKKTYEVKVEEVLDEVKEEAIKLKGFKKFLLDFSLIYEKKAIEVVLWEDYLIFAMLLGIAKKVEKQFEKVYPQFASESAYNYDITTVLYDFSASGYSGYTSSISSSSSSSSSGGFGGSSSSSGGSSAGGSSGGGFR